MATLNKYNLKGKEIGKVKIDDSLVNAEANGQMIKDYIVAIRANARQWSANTKTRAEVSHTTKKPHKQKGQGRARHGNLVGPQFRGGGRVGTPKPKFDQHVRINKKERRAAIRSLIAEKIKENRLHVLDSTEIEAPKTRAVADFLKATSLYGTRVLFLGEGTYADVEAGNESKKVSIHSDQHQHFRKSVRNLPKVEFALASNISGYDVVVARDIVITEAALAELQQWLS